MFPCCLSRSLIISWWGVLYITQNFNNKYYNLLICDRNILNTCTCKLKAKVEMHSCDLTYWNNKSLIENEIKQCLNHACFHYNLSKRNQKKKQKQNKWASQWWNMIGFVYLPDLHVIGSCQQSLHCDWPESIKCPIYLAKAKPKAITTFISSGLKKPPSATPCCK